MRAALVLLLLAGPALAAAEAPTMRLETEAPFETWIGLEVPVTLRVLVDLEAFEAASVRLFPRALDLQLKVTAPWMTPAAVPAGDGSLSLVLNDKVVAFRRGAARDGLAVLEVKGTILPEKPGPLELAAPTFEFIWATEFEDDFVSGRRPLDRLAAKGTGDARRVLVRELPEEGRPDGFSGAVGRFIVLATVEPDEVAVGEEFTLTLRIQGTGNLERFAPPTVAPDGFHVLGRIDDRASPVRTIRYDLSPIRGGIEALPSLPFPFFDPETGRYAAGATAPIPLVVRGDVPGPLAEKHAHDRSSFPWPIILGAGACLFLVILLRRRATRRRPEPAPPTAAESFFEQAEADLTAALTSYLATRLGCAKAAVISPDLGERLEGAGVGADLAERASALVAALVGARYGGEAGGDELRTATELVQELESDS